MKTLKAALFIIALALTGCDQNTQTLQPQKPDGPTAVAVQSFIQQNLPPYFTVQNVQVESFIDPTLMRGRLSVAGELVLNEDLYRGVSEYELIRIFSINPDDFKRYKKGVLPNVAQIRTPKGQKASFQAEYLVAKNVNGWSLDGRPAIPGVFEGEPRTSLENHVLISDPQVKSYFQAIKTQVSSEQDKYSTLNRAVLTTFTQGARFRCSLTGRDYSDAETKKPPFIMTVSATPTIQEDGRDVYGNPKFSFRVPVEILWLSSNKKPPSGVYDDDNLTADVVLDGEMSFALEPLAYVLSIGFPSPRGERYRSFYNCVYDGKSFSQYLSGYMGFKIQPEVLP